MTYSAPPGCWCLDCYLIDGLIAKTERMKRPQPSTTGLQKMSLTHTAPGMPTLELSAMTGTPDYEDDKLARRMEECRDLVTEVEKLLSERNDKNAGIRLIVGEGRFEQACVAHVMRAYRQLGWDAEFTETQLLVLSIPPKEMASKNKTRAHDPVGSGAAYEATKPNVVTAIKDPLSEYTISREEYDRFIASYQPSLTQDQIQSAKAEKGELPTETQDPKPAPLPRDRFQVVRRGEERGCRAEYFLSQSGAHAQAREYNAGYPELFDPETQTHLSPPDTTWAVIDTTTEPF